MRTQSVAKLGLHLCACVRGNKSSSTYTYVYVHVYEYSSTCTYLVARYRRWYSSPNGTRVRGFCAGQPSLDDFLSVVLLRTFGVFGFVAYSCTCTAAGKAAASKILRAIGIEVLHKQAYDGHFGSRADELEVHGGFCEWRSTRV